MGEAPHEVQEGVGPGGLVSRRGPGTLGRRYGGRRPSSPPPIRVRIRYGGRRPSAPRPSEGSEHHRRVDVIELQRTRRTIWCPLFCKVGTRALPTRPVDPVMAIRMSVDSSSGCALGL